MKRGQYDYPQARWALPVMITAENWRNLAEDVDGAVADVANGYDPVAAGNLIRFFHFALRDGALFDHCTNLTEAERGMLDFVAMAFGRYVEGNGKKSLDHAFGVKRGQGNISTGLGDRNITIAAMVVLEMRRKTTWLDAIGNAANRFFPDGKGQRACEDAYAEHKNILQTLSTDELKAILGMSDQIPDI